MLAILEIIFTVAAWRKGWRWRALLPIALPVLVGFILGLSVASSGGSVQDAQRLVEEIQGFAIFLELVCLGALIVMTIRGPRAPQKTQEVEYHYQTVPPELSVSNGSHNGAEIAEVNQYAGNHRY